MTFIDAMAALQEGAIPTNDQCVAFLQHLEVSLPSRDGMSEKGSSLVLDLKTFFEVICGLLQERNGREELQEFLWRTRGAAHDLNHQGLKLKWGKDADRDSVGNKAKKAKAKVERAGEAIQTNGEQAGVHLRTLARLLLVQPELRHIVGDLSFVLLESVDNTAGELLGEARTNVGQVQSATGTFQNVAKKALAQAKAQQATSGGARSVTALLQEPDEDNSNQSGLSPTLLHEQLTTIIKNGDISIASIRDELADGNRVPALEELRVQAQKVATSISKNSSDLQNMSGEINKGKIPPQVLEVLTSTESGTSIEPSSRQREGNVTPTDLVDGLQILAITKKRMFMNRDKNSIGELSKQARREAQKNLHDAFTEEVKQRLIARSKKLLVDCQSSSQYKDAMSWLLNRIESLFTTLQTKIETPSTLLTSAQSSATEPLVMLLENFADGQKLLPLLELAHKLSLGAKADPEIQNFWSNADSYLRQCLLEEGFVLTSKADAKLAEVTEQFKNLRQAYKRDLSAFVHGISSFLNAIRNDAFITKLLKAGKIILQDIGKDGWRKSSLMNDIRHHILPGLLDKVAVIPVPRIKYLHPDFDLVVENIALELKSLLPDIFDVRMTNDVHLDFRKIKDSTHSHTFKIKLRGMSLRVYNLAFAVTSRFLFTFHDRGVADLIVRNFGVTIYVEIPKNPGPHYFLVRKVNVKLDKLRLKVHRSNHRILHFMADRLANSFLTKRILRHFIGVGIGIGLKQLDVALMTHKLSKGQENQSQEVRETIRLQMAELRDLLRKYHEQAGTLEIDFTRPDTGEHLGTLGSNAKAAVGKSIEESHAVRWIKNQVDRTARKEIKRSRWRSNAFDIDGFESKWAEGLTAVPSTNSNIDVRTSNYTNLAPEKDAELQLRREESRLSGERSKQQSANGMESSAGKSAVSANSKVKNQAHDLEEHIDHNALEF